MQKCSCDDVDDNHDDDAWYEYGGLTNWLNWTATGQDTSERGDEGEVQLQPDTSGNIITPDSD